MQYPSVLVLRGLQCLCLLVVLALQTARGNQPSTDLPRDLSKYYWKTVTVLAKTGSHNIGLEDMSGQAERDPYTLLMNLKAALTLLLAVEELGALTEDGVDVPEEVVDVVAGGEVMLLQEDGVTYVLSDKLNQDPLEQHFAKQRRRCGANEHPTVLEYGRNEINIQVAGAMLDAVRPRGSNCGGRANDAQIDLNDDTPLAKRQRKR
ncbi:Hypp6357 [Branchiostoma lanceolatum]|uniref:Hypp6357 protein n=1 Tax=Branchiostoma lanceolatum TaxID=7740 RepID=A0A8J9YTE2_BRALA|nr:Hypp6357 [Branchiostoma lanceolatum]